MEVEIHDDCIVWIDGFIWKPDQKTLERVAKEKEAARRRLFGDRKNRSNQKHG